MPSRILNAAHAFEPPYLRLYESGKLARRGLLLRHLVMPGDTAGTREVMRWIARELSLDTYVNVMSQYYPAGRVSYSEYAEIDRQITPGEYERALEEAWGAGLQRLEPRRPSYLATF